MKICKDCLVDKPESEFYVMKRMPDGLHYYCRACMRTRTATWKKNNPEKVSALNSRMAASGYWLERSRRPAYKAASNQRGRVWAIANRSKRVATENKRRAAKFSGGSYTEDEWSRLCSEYNNLCLRCGTKDRITVDHVVPISRGGTNKIDNLQPLCLSCNCSKGTKTIDYRKKMN